MGKNGSDRFYKVEYYGSEKIHKLASGRNFEPVITSHCRRNA